MARDLGILDVDRMLDELPVDLYLEWFHYYGGSPSLGARIDYVGGLVSAVLANLWRKKGSRATQPSQFIPRWDRYFDSFGDPEVVKQKKSNHMLQKVELLNALFGGKDTRKH